MLDLYKIEGTQNNDTNPCFNDSNLYPNFQSQLGEFKSHLVDMVSKNENKTFYKFGDGDYYFLRQEHMGSATPGKRALSKDYSQINHQEFLDGVLKNDFVSVEIYPENRRMFNSIFPDRKIDYPAEYGYALVSNKWFFKTFNGKIGLIGGSEKINLIKELMRNEQYQNFLGIEKFNDYISIPEKFACDDIEQTEKMVGEQLLKSTSDIFLLGIGHVKSALTHRFKKYKKAVYVDVGGGINAIAGVVSLDRPYAGIWTNYRLKNYDYSKVDQMDYNDTAGRNDIYI